MKNVVLKCKECGNLFGILSNKSINNAVCPHCGGTDIDYPNGNEEDKVMEHIV